MDVKLLLLLLLAGAVGNAAGRVTIRSKWGGLGTPQDQSLSFTCAPNFGSAKSGRCSAFRHLVAALESPRAEYSPESLGITTAWLAANVDSAVEHDLPKHDRPHSKDQIALFRAIFLDPAKTDTLVRSFAYGTDDYPSFSLEAIDSDGSRIGIRSDDQSICMVPWLIDFHGQQYLGYDRRVSDAIFALLPKGFPNRERIGGLYLREKFSQSVLASIQKDWNRLGSKVNVAGPFGEIESRFEILDSSIVTISSIDVGEAEFGSSHGWKVELRPSRVDYPLTIGLFLPFAKGQQPTTETFLRRVNYFIDLVTSVQWLRTYVEGHPPTRVDLRFVGDRSFSIKAATSMVHDLRRNGQTAVSKVVEASAPDSAFIEVQDEKGQWSRWLVLPDRRTVLWHFKGPKALHFPDEQFRTWDFAGWRSAGALISPEGTPTRSL
jgi:hypothetical protein